MVLLISLLFPSVEPGGGEPVDLAVSAVAMVGKLFPANDVKTKALIYVASSYEKFYYGNYCSILHSNTTTVVSIPLQS